jgi:hypothetical protein
VLFNHVLVDGFAALNLGDKSASRLGKFSQEAFVPHLLIRVATSGALSGTYAHKDTDFPSGPFADDGLVQCLGGGVKGSDAVIVVYGLADPNGLEC